MYLLLSNKNSVVHLHCDRQVNPKQRVISVISVLQIHLFLGSAFYNKGS